MTRVLQAKNGTITEEMRTAAGSEGLDPSVLCARVADGSVVITRNTNRSITPLAIGTETRIKINANIGTSSARSDLREELDKMRIAVKYGADAIMDLSTAGDLAAIRSALISECPVAVGTVPLYEMAVNAKNRGKSVLDITPDEMFDVIEAQCAQGVDFVTLHCSATRPTASRCRNS